VDRWDAIIAAAVAILALVLLIASLVVAE